MRSPLAAVVLTFAATAVQALSLAPRDLNGDGVVDAYFSASQNLSWLAQLHTPVGPAWSDSIDWAQNLSVHGISGWRLPQMQGDATAVCDMGSVDGGRCGFNPDPQSSELAQLFYATLGNTALVGSNGNYNFYQWVSSPDGYELRVDFSGIGWVNTSPFTGLAKNDLFWMRTTGEDHAAYLFDGAQGMQALTDRNTFSQGLGPAPDGGPYSLKAWAVRDGDVGAAATGVVTSMPEPSTFVALMAGLLAVGVVTRQRLSTPR